MTAVPLMDLGEFRRLGYLAEVNRRLLHPLGLALAITLDKSGVPIALEVQDHRDDPEGVYFDKPSLIARLAARVLAEEEKRRPAREAALGYWVQPLPSRARRQP